MNYFIIIIFIIIIILLLLKLFDINVDFFDEVNSEKLNLPKINVDMLETQDGTVKLKEDILDDDVKIKTQSTGTFSVPLSVDRKDKSSEGMDKGEKEIEKIRDKGKSELNNDITIVPQKIISIDLTKEENKEKPKKELSKDEDTKHILVESSEKRYDDVLNELSHRYDNQEKEYKKAFKGKNELDYQGQVITDENIYQFDDFNYINANQLYIPTDYKTKEEDYGRNYIPPELWYKNNRRLNLPVCVPANHRCTIKDNLTTGYPVDVIEWHESRKVLNPDGINLKYVKEKLNTNHDIQ